MIEDFYKDISNLEIPSVEELEKLLKTQSATDIATKLIPITIKIARKYQRAYNLPNEDFLELIQLQNLEIIKIIPAFQEEKARFLTYIFNNCHLACKSFMNKRAFPQKITTYKAFLAKKIKDDLQINPKLTMEEILLKYNIKEKDYLSLLDIIKTPMYIDGEQCRDEDDNYEFELADNAMEEKIISINNKAKFLSLMKKYLSPREYIVIDMKFGVSNEKPKKNHEIGTVFGVSEQRIQQIFKKAIEKMNIYKEEFKNAFES